MKYNIQEYLRKMKERKWVCFPVEGKNISEIPRLAVFLAHFLVVLIAYQLLLNFHLAGDGYPEAVNGYSSMLFVSLGRYTAAILARIIQFIGITTIASHQQVFTVCFLLISAMFSYMVLCLFYKYIPNKSLFSFITLNAAALLIVVNPFICQWQLFSDGLVMFGSGLFFMILALYAHRKEGLLANGLACVWLYLSLGSYQSNIGYYIILGLLLMLLRNDLQLTKKSLFDSASIVVGGAIASLANLATMEAIKNSFGMAETGRESSIHLQTILANVKYVLGDQTFRWKSGLSIAPTYFALGFTVLILLGITVLLIIQRRKLNNAFYIFFTLFCGYVSIYLSHFVSEDARMYFSIRTITPWFASIFACVVVLLVLWSTDVHSISYPLRKILSVLMCLFLCLSEWAVTQTGKEQLMTNAVDQQDAATILSEISSYESHSGKQITTIKIGRDESILAYHPFVRHGEAGTVRAFAFPGYAFWCLTYVSNGRTFEQQEMSADDPIYQQFFAGKDWSYFDVKEQTKFVENTLYLILY